MMLAVLISLMLLQGDFSAPLRSGRNDMSEVSGRNDTTSVIPSEASVIPSEAEESIDVAEIIFEHIGDEYEWHITEWKGKPVAIPLPCIVIEDGVHIFTLHHAAENGYTLNENGKLVNAATGKRPIDISITKNVLSLMMSSLLLLVIVLLTARWYKRHDVLEQAPTGLAAAMEPLVMMVHNMAKENIGPDYKRYSPSFG